MVERRRPYPAHHPHPRVLTVDALARTAGTTTRQVRALQTRGLLPRPRLVGRTGVYDEAHLDRLRAVLRLQDDGFSLAAIFALVRAWEEGRSLSDVLGLPRVLGLAAASDTDGDADADAFEGLVAPWGGRLLSVVPTTVVPTIVVEVPAAS